MWWRRLAEVQTEHQNGEERGFKWLWTWNVCWCQTGWSEYFKNCLVPIEHRLNATAYPSIVAYHVHPFMTTVHPSSDGYFQQDNAPCHKAQIISDWFLKHDNEFTLLKWPPVTRPLSNRAPLACGGTGDFASWMCSRQICSNCVMLSCQYGQKSLRNVSSTLLNLWHEELRFWRQKGVQPGTSKMYLCPVFLWLSG